MNYVKNYGPRDYVHYGNTLKNFNFSNGYRTSKPTIKALKLL